MANIEKRTSQSGELSYRAKIRLKGHPAESATFERLTDAKRWVQATEDSMREGRYFKTSEAKKHTLSELVDRYIKTVLPRKPKSQVLQTAQLTKWKEEIGSYTIADVTPALLISCRDKMQNEPLNEKGRYRTPATLNRYMAALSHAFTIAIKEWNWLETNPTLKIDKLKEPRGRVRFLSDEERQRLLDVCKKSESKYLYKIVVLALSTGARRNEIIKLDWKDLDLNRAVITLHDTKNNERRILPLRGHAMDLMKEHAKVRNLHCHYVFTSDNECKPIDIRTAWETALKKANIEDFRFHDLRHSAASYLAMNGASLAEIAEVLGHKTLQMVKRYAHLSEAHTASVVERMNNKIFG
jgi:integrase